MSIICAWHKLYFPGESNVIKEGDDPKAMVSHSICEDCSEIVKEQHENEK